MKTSLATLALAVLALSLASPLQALPLNTDDLGLLGQGVDGSLVDERDVPTGETGDGLTADELEDLRVLGLDEASRGEFRRAARTGFDPYEDTVDFGNRGGVITKDGVCAGMSAITRMVWQRVEFVDGSAKPGNLGAALLKALTLPMVGRQKVEGAASLRDLSVKDPGLEGQLLKIFEVAMLQNLTPGTLRSGVGGITHLEPGDVTAAWVEGRAARGEPSLMTYSGEGCGHVTLAYKVLAFANLKLVYVYDCNAVYRREEATHRTTVLVARRDDRSLRLYPESYAGWYGGRYDAVTCGESLMQEMAGSLGRALTVAGPQALAQGVRTGLAVGASAVAGVARFLVGGVAGLFGN